jgi:hypothetical protein
MALTPVGFAILLAKRPASPTNPSIMRQNLVNLATNGPNNHLKAASARAPRPAETSGVTMNEQMQAAWRKMVGVALLWVALATLVYVPSSNGGERVVALFADGVKRDIVRQLRRDCGSKEFTAESV